MKKEVNKKLPRQNLLSGGVLMSQKKLEIAAAALGRKGGQVRSEAKKAAARKRTASLAALAEARAARAAKRAAERETAALE